MKSQAVINEKVYERACDIAPRLGMAEWYLIKLGNTGKVPSVKLGRVRWFNYAEVLNARQGMAEIPKRGRGRPRKNTTKYAALDGI